jgi:hypothetical protein
VSLLNGSSSGIIPTHHSGTRSLEPTSQKSMNHSQNSLTMNKPQSSCTQQHDSIRNAGSCAKYLSAPACGSVNYANLESMRSDVSVTTTGSKSPSANSTPTDTCHYTQSCSSSSQPAKPAPDQTTPTDSSPTKTADLSTGSAFHEPLPPAPETPASVTFTHTNSDTPSPPKPSTAA